MRRGRGHQQRRCTVPDCSNPHFAKGMCKRHYRQKRRLEGPRCTVPGCNRAVAVRERGLCAGHLKDPTRTIRVLRAKGVMAVVRLGPSRSEGKTCVDSGSAGTTTGAALLHLAERSMDTAAP